MGDRQPRQSGGDVAPWLILGVMGAGLVALAVIWAGGTLGAALTGGGWRPPPFSLHTLVLFFTGGPPALWPKAPAAGPVIGMVALVAAATAATAATVRKTGWRRRPDHGMADARQMAELTAKGMQQRARILRPALANSTDRLPCEQLGIRLGDLQPSGPSLYASWEDTLLALMGPRSGKTSAVAAPTILRAPGPVVATSLREDIYTLTATARARRHGPDGQPAQIWVLDASGTTFLPREWWFDILERAGEFEGGYRLAGHFISLLGDADRVNSDFWLSSARALLTGMFMSAARSRRPVSDVLRWLGNPADTTPLDALRGHPLGTDLRSRMDAAIETRDGIYQTAREAVSCLLDPEILAWITPPDPGGADRYRKFQPDQFVAGVDSLYLLSRKGTASAAGIVAALTDAVLRAAERRADRSAGRMDPPLTVLLDEAANIGRISDLPDLYSYMGGKGISLTTIIQNYPQGESAWGKTGMAALWSASTIKLIGAGIDDARLAEDLSKLIGEREVMIRSVSHGSGRSTSTSPQLRRILPPDKIRALRRGDAVLFASGHPVAPLTLRPWYREPDASDREAEVAEQRRQLQHRAEQLTRTAGQDAGTDQAGDDAGAAVRFDPDLQGVDPADTVLRIGDREAERRGSPGPGHTPADDDPWSPAPPPPLRPSDGQELPGQWP